MSKTRKRKRPKARLRTKAKKLAGKIKAMVMDVIHLMYVPVYMDVEAVKKLSATDYKLLKFADDATFTSWINDFVISGIESRIAQITGKTWTAATAPEGVKQIAHLAGSNILVYIRVNQMGPLIQRGEFNLAAPQVPTFTEEMLKDLRRFNQRTEQIAVSDYKVQALKDTWEEP